MNNNLELLDLEKMVITVKESVKRFSQESEYSLSDGFKEALREEFPDYTFDFYERTLRVGTPSGQFIYAANQSFALASRLMAYCAEIGKYRGIARDILNRNQDKLKMVVHQGGKLEDDVFTELRDQKNDSLKKEFETGAREYFKSKCVQGDVAENTARLMRFVTSYQWWLGGKQISRSNDWAISPISTLLNMPQNDSNFVARAASKATDNPEYRIAFEHAVEREWKESEYEENPSLIYRTGIKSKYGRNRILFGAPGTGKSFTLRKDTIELLGTDNEESYERVTFHPDYSYANFVGTYKPVMTEGGDISYEYVPGPFMRVYVKALKNARTGVPKPFLLIIEEINRANVAAVFGDIFQLLDRNENQVSDYPIQASEDMKKYLAKELGGKPGNYSQIRIPDNMFLWATMNSADQGVFPMDTAFKRRWNFTYLGIDESDGDIRGKYVSIANEKQHIEWNELRKAINDFLADEKINEDKQLGPYFISRSIVVPENGGTEIDSKKFCDVFKNKVLMYLFDDAARQKRTKIFEGSEKGQTRYSKICEAFDEQGIGIFHADIQNRVKLY